MQYLTELFYAACRETWEAVVANTPRQLLVAALVVIGTAFVYWRRKGFDEMKDVLFSSGAVVLATIGVFICLFLFHFFFLTPEHLLEDSRKRSKGFEGLHGEVETIAVGPTSSGKTAVMASICIRNSGAETIAEDYALQITRKDGTQIKAVLYAIVDKMEITIKDKIFTIHSEDEIYGKTITPIARGGLVRGWLYAIADVPSDQVGEENSSISVTFKDVTQTLHRITPGERKYEGEPNTLPYRAGLKLPESRPADQPTSPTPSS